MKRILSALAAAAVVVVMLSTAQTASAVPPTPSFPASIDPYASYVTPGCDPTAKPGVVAFRGILKTEYGRADLGITRPCAQGEPSDHHDGRALDYPFNAFDSSQLADANALLNWLLATDQYGNRHALARRLGINYMIWNRKIWKAYEPSAGWQAYNGPSPHTDHIHFSFGRPGALKQTSWWTSGGVDRPAESVNGDNYDDLLAVDPDNVMRVFPGTVNGNFGTSYPLGPAGRRRTTASRSATPTRTGSPTSSPPPPTASSTTGTTPAAEPSPNWPTPASAGPPSNGSPSSTSTATTKQTSSPEMAASSIGTRAMAPAPSANESRSAKAGPPTPNSPAATPTATETATSGEPMPAATSPSGKAPATAPSPSGSQSDPAGTASAPSTPWTSTGTARPTWWPFAPAITTCSAGPARATAPSTPAKTSATAGPATAPPPTDT